jgi:hypothetical protein
VIDAIQGEGFNPLWHQVLIVFNQGFTPHQFVSKMSPGGCGWTMILRSRSSDGRGLPLFDRWIEVGVMTETAASRPDRRRRVVSTFEWADGRCEGHSSPLGR